MVFPFPLFLSNLLIVPMQARRGCNQSTHLSADTRTKYRVVASGETALLPSQ